MTADFNLTTFASECVARGLTKSQAKEELERIGMSHLRSELSPLMRDLRGEAKPRPNFAQRQAAARLVNATFEPSAEKQAKIDAAFAVCHTRLVAVGAILDNESDSGSRYYTLADGRKVRVADHEANGATQHWIDMHEVASVRVDGGWEADLEALV